MFDLDQLQATAEAATPGPWTADCCSAANMVYGPSDSIGVDAVRSDAEFIAAWNPAVALELVASHRDALARIARVEALHKPYPTGAAYCVECSGAHGADLTEWPCDTLRALEGEEDGR